MNSGASSRSECNLPSTSAVSKRPSEDSGEEPPREKLRAASGEDVPRTDGWGRSLLHLAAEGGDADRVRELIQRGADTRVQDTWGRTPLHRALYWGEEAAAELLVAADCSNDVQDEDGYTPLHWAAWGGYVKTIGNLLAGGASTRVQNAWGETAIHHALYQGREAAAELLAEADPANDVRDEEGSTPLHYAAEKTCQGVVKKILLSGTNPHVKDHLGNYPIGMALRSRWRNETIPKMILSAYALGGIPVDPQELRLEENDLPFCIEALSRCDEEIRLMERTRVPASSVSYHHLLTRHVARVASRLPVEGAGEATRSDIAGQNFPIYADLIACKIRAALKRRVLTDRCLECFSLLSPPLPTTCADVVLLCLWDRDMENFVRAVRLESGTPAARGDEPPSP